MEMGAQIPGSWPLWVVAGVVFVMSVILAAFLFSVVLRKMLRPRAAQEVDEFAPRQPKSEDQSAFLAASMQAVIKRLREQEKELERLHRLEKERAQQTERLSLAVTRSMPTGLLLVNANGLVQMANPAAEKALGIGALSFQRYSDVLGADAPLTRLLASCLLEGRTYQREEVDHCTPGGEVRHLGVTISPTAPQGAAADPARTRPAGALCLLSDLTELTALQRQIRLKENMAALGEMSAGIAHEFKNALGIISGYAQMIRSEASAGELADSADRILKETRALTHVVTEFLRFARPLELMQETVALGELVDQVVAEVSEAVPGVSLNREGEFDQVSGDAGMLRQALLNLVRNAAEAAAAHSSAGRVTVRGTVESTAGSTPTEGLRPAGGQGIQRVSVLDNGPGIPAEDLSKLFVPFYTTKSNGTGLGLAVVQKIALQHGGSVEARNQSGGGAEFILSLPLSRETTQAVESGGEGI